MTNKPPPEGGGLLMYLENITNYCSIKLVTDTLCLLFGSSRGWSAFL
jgi:hypothetical protein